MSAGVLRMLDSIFGSRKSLMPKAHHKTLQLETIPNRTTRLPVRPQNFYVYWPFTWKETGKIAISIIISSNNSVSGSGSQFAVFYTSQPILFNQWLIFR